LLKLALLHAQLQLIEANDTYQNEIGENPEQCNDALNVNTLTKAVMGNKIFANEISKMAMEKRELLSFYRIQGLHQGFFLLFHHS